MKKIYLLAAMAAMFLGFTACSDDDTASPVNYQQSSDVSNYGTATVTGIALATLDATLASDVKQYAPAGTKLFLTVKNSDLYKLPGGGDPAGTYELETTVGANGAFTFPPVPAKIGGTTITIKGDNFKANYKVSDTKTEVHAYGIGATIYPAALTVYPDGSLYVTINFGSGDVYPYAVVY